MSGIDGDDWSVIVQVSKEEDIRKELRKAASDVQELAEFIVRQCDELVPEDGLKLYQVDVAAEDPELLRTLFQRVGRFSHSTILVRLISLLGGLEYAALVKPAEKRPIDIHSLKPQPPAADVKAKTTKARKR